MLLLLGVVALGTSVGLGQAKKKLVELRVSAAADLQPVMPAIAFAYERAHGVKLKVSFGSSAMLAQQILNGAQTDIFLGADYTYPEKIVAADLAEGRDAVPYAKGTLVLWARKDSPLGTLNLDRLTDPRGPTVAIANELHAPYGRAAVAALRRLNIYDKVAPHLVVAENVAQAAQFAESGSAQLGLISLTLASSEHLRAVGSYVLVPDVYPEIRQCAVILRRSDRKVEAQQFLDWLLSPEVQGKLHPLGLEPVR